MSARRVVFIGAAGEMCRVAIERFAKADGEWDLVLCDIRSEILEPLVKRLPAGCATVRRLDLFDRRTLRDVVDGAALVVLGAGPYVRTSGPVIEACLEAKVPYLDFDDDVESTEHALYLHEKATAAGIPIYVGCGASPGMSNVMAVDAANDLDSVERIDLCWLVGDERPDVGRAVLEHMLHISAGDCLTWENGRRVNHETFVESDTFPILAGEPEVLLYETAHPEPVTLPNRYPDAKRIRCVGGLDPAPLNGFFRGMGLAIQNGKIAQKDAVDFVHNVVTGGLGTPSGWKHSISGMRAQVKRGDSTSGLMWKFLGVSALRRTFPYKGGLLTQVRGTKDGKPAVSGRRTQMLPGYAMNNMGGVTGTACAAFALLALDEVGQRAGAFAPEGWADPQAFYKALERVGVPRQQIVESVR
ncbi:MAG: saccharopine dehydrogenase [Actinophytocola sp.]|nr:saccharopine dehydrogenase [Actinophytocola sp.]